MYIFYKFSFRSLIAQGRFDSGWRLRPFCHVRKVSFSGVPQAVTRFFATSLDKWEPFIQLPLSKKFIVFDKIHSFRQKKFIVFNKSKTYTKCWKSKFSKINCKFWGLTRRFLQNNRRYNRRELRKKIRENSC